jgi:hypothetical protein
MKSYKKYLSEKESELNVDKLNTNLTKDEPKNIDGVFTDFEKLNKDIINPKKLKDEDSKSLLDYVDEFEKEQTDFKDEYKDIYAVYTSIDNVVKNEYDFEKIQSIDSRIDIKNNSVNVTVTTKDRGEENKKILDMFLEQLKEYNKDIKGLKYDVEYEDMDLGSMENGSNGKYIMHLIVSGKGEI